MKVFLENAVAGFLIGLILGGIVMGWFFISIGRDDIRGQAIKAGVAHWEVDPQTGKTTFCWNSGREKAHD